MIRGIHHIAMNTSNFDKMLTFYKEAFGFEPGAEEVSWKETPLIDNIVGVKNSAARCVMLKAGTCYLELFEYSAPKGRDGEPLKPMDRGYTHFCIDVTDIKAEYERLKKLGMTFVHPEPISVGDTSAVYGRDPDGNIIEIQETKQTVPYSLYQLAGAPPKTTRG